MRFGFLLKRGKPEARAIAADLGRVLHQQGCAPVVLEEDASALPGARVVSTEQLGGAIDALVVLGGDGTLLFGAGLVADHGVPIFGVNLGSLGFITHYARNEAAHALAEACHGRLGIEERVRLAITIGGTGGPGDGESRCAVNDAVFTQPALARLLDLEARLDGAVIATYKADGLIVATPTGSTAYTLAAGGPILTPDVEATILTPICPHTLTHRPIVVRSDAEVRVTNVSGGPAHLTVDGQWGNEIPDRGWITVRKAAKPLRLFKSPTPFFGILRKKLSWGERKVDGNE
ncbi:MAG TPA: NAD(+)/NADH kinase [Polyangia bacterium]|nr:NAD(+)/NADH kinase [Polyangia bacterium]